MVLLLLLGSNLQQKPLRLAQALALLQPRCGPQEQQQQQQSAAVPAVVAAAA
jgi:hypothetical protein